MTFLDQIREIEYKWQKKWKENNTFVGNVDKNRQKWYITVPYPYASGPMHIGHCRTYNLGDLVTRYMRQKGYNVLWPMAYHITGTPVLSVSAKIKNKDKKTYELYKDYVSIYEQDEKKIEEIVTSFEEPMNVAMYFSSKLLEDFQRMGLSIDDTRQFTTGDPDYNKFIEWQYMKLYEKGLIDKGSYPILWCTRCINAVGEDDIQDGDEEKTDVTEFVGIKYRMEDGTNLVAATLRPETIFGATNVWVHPEGTYVQVQIDEEKWIVSEESAQKLIEQNHKVEIIKKIKGQELIEQKVEIPLLGTKIPIYPATFVDLDHATGVVYSVPGHAPYDYIALADLQKDEKTIEKYNIDKESLKAIQPISLIKVDGYGEWPAVEICTKLDVTRQTDKEKLEKATQTIYKDEYYTGIMKENTGEFKDLKVEQAKESVAQKLIQEGRASPVYETSRKAFCRCGGNVIVAVISDQYFLNYGDKEWKHKATKALNSMKILPEKYRQSFEHTFTWLDKRPCVRKRGLGTEFPITKGEGWIIESLSDSVIYMAYYTVVRTIRSNKIEAAQLIPEVFDYVFLEKGNIKEVSKQSKIDEKILKEMQEEFQYWYPNDFRHTAINHISNHLSFTIFHHSAIFSEKYAVKAFSLNEMLIREGQKMGKSKGNVIPMAHIPQKYSVDLTRLHLASVASAETVVDWREKEVNYSLQRIKKFWDYFEDVKDTKNEKKISYSFPSKAVLSQIKANLKKAVDCMDNFNFRDYILNGFFANIRAMEEYEKIAKQLDREEYCSVMKKTIEDVVVTMAPVIPHICEEINEQLGQTKFISCTQIPNFELSEEDKKYAQQALFVSDVMEDINQILKLVKKEPKNIYIYLNASWKNTLYGLAKELFSEEAFNIGKLMEHAKMNAELVPYMKHIANEAKLMMKDPTIFRITMMSPEEQKASIEGYKSFIGKNYSGANITVYIDGEEVSYDPQNKAGKARPMKPALLIE